jgi:hypothetical protein
MWLITTLIAAIIVTLLWYKAPKKYRLEIPSLMLWGATFMILVDHLIGYESGTFFEMETDGLVTNSIYLGILMILPVILFWGVVLLVKKPKAIIEKR